jgi:hypothetical protein
MGADAIETVVWVVVICVGTVGSSRIIISGVLSDDTDGAGGVGSIAKKQEK